jgi:hypothetical protein
MVVAKANESIEIADNRLVALRITFFPPTRFQARTILVPPEPFQGDVSIASIPRKTAPDHRRERKINSEKLAVIRPRLRKKRYSEMNRLRKTLPRSLHVL